MANILMVEELRNLLSHMSSPLTVLTTELLSPDILNKITGENRSESAGVSCKSSVSGEMIYTMSMDMKDSCLVMQWCILILITSLRLPSIRTTSSSNNPSERIVSR